MFESRCQSLLRQNDYIMPDRSRKVRPAYGTGLQRTSSRSPEDVLDSGLRYPDSSANLVRRANKREADPAAYRHRTKQAEPLLASKTENQVVGVELWRATTLGSGGRSGGFPTGLSPAPLVHVSIGPPAIPDGRISRVRF